MQKLIIFSGNFQEARQFAATHELQKDQWLYVDSVTRIIGLRGNRCVKIGTWWQRPDALEIKQRIAINDFKEVGLA